MSDFEFLFGFYGLLLGLALANVTTGLADVWRADKPVRLGICTPLLALAIVSVIVAQWNMSWSFRDQIKMQPMELVWNLGSTLPYIFLSHAIFPKHAEKWESLDDYYLDHRRVLLTLLMIAPVIAIVSNAIAYSDFSLDPAIRTVMTIIVPAAVLRTRNRWLHAGALVIVSAYYILARLLEVW